MGKYDIVFNNKKYAIDESSLSSAADALKSHLSTVMSGSGTVINLGGISYNVDSTKLSSATTDFINHLSSISGNGYKVVIGGNEYSIASDKVASVISGLETVFDGLNSGDDFYIEENEAGGETIYIIDTNAVLLNENNEASGQSAIID